MIAGGLLASACSDSAETSTGFTVSDETAEQAEDASNYGSGAENTSESDDGGADNADGSSTGSTTAGSAPTTSDPGPGDLALTPPLNLDVPDPNTIFDPVRAGEELPQGFRQLLPRDGIAPVYDPQFTLADGVDWPQESLVIGVNLEGEARAYPVGFLNRREIVNDNHRGIPTLVTW